jgi:hypothetical protein
LYSAAIKVVIIINKKEGVLNVKTELIKFYNSLPMAPKFNKVNKSDFYKLSNCSIRKVYIYLLLLIPIVFYDLGYNYITWFIFQIMP